MAWVTITKSRGGNNKIQHDLSLSFKKNNKGHYRLAIGIGQEVSSLYGLKIGDRFVLRHDLSTNQIGMFATNNPDDSFSLTGKRRRIKNEKMYLTKVFSPKNPQDRKSVNNLKLMLGEKKLYYYKYDSPEIDIGEEAIIFKINLR